MGYAISDMSRAGTRCFTAAAAGLARAKAPGYASFALRVSVTPFGVPTLKLVYCIRRPFATDLL